jgi:hypothetical protein
MRSRFRARRAACDSGGHHLFAVVVERRPHFQRRDHFLRDHVRIDLFDISLEFRMFVHGS